MTLRYFKRVKDIGRQYEVVENLPDGARVEYCDGKLTIHWPDGGFGSIGGISTSYPGVTSFSVSS